MTVERLCSKNRLLLIKNKDTPNVLTKNGSPCHALEIYIRNKTMKIDCYHGDPPWHINLQHHRVFKAKNQLKTTHQIKVVKNPCSKYPGNETGQKAIAKR